MKKFKLKKIKSLKVFIFLGLVLTMFTAFIINFKSFAYTPSGNNLINNNITNFENLIIPSDSVYNYVFTNNEIIINKKNNSSFNSFNGSFTFSYSSNVSVNSSLDTYIYFIAFTHKGVDLNFEFSNENESLFDYYYIENQTVDLQYDCYLWRLNANNNLYFNTLDISFKCSSTYNKNVLYLYLNSIQFVGYDYPNSSFIKNMFNPTLSDTIYINSNNTDYESLQNEIYNEFLQEYQSQMLEYEGTINNQQTTINQQQQEINQLKNANSVLQQQLANAQNDYNLNNLVWSIGGTPFETFKTIWNFEFFGVNISNLIFGLLTGLIIIWIIKKFFL